ncbi:hypothetical protein EHQ68_09540 [Leptospira congkakensis]|uniref:Prenyltransferase n=1 Tax=Leptospira congkakensis TaxID=2484932 RepID=A0A4Z1A5G1_9LEPT|nr:hypothetical protein [Leptospira congkakensis]TGL86000.1 hypothetical protein EHQ69_18135 [Leptospira congkakensis]TGL88873.1 hypothetical protein EHQ68_09540 [Leptospira congkakensis]TGL93377.1 hypothetical protein EHQ70_17705 [Leptospira congkakensis]
MFPNGFAIRFGKLSSFLAIDVLVSLLANLSFFSLYGNEKIRFTLLIFYTSSVWALYLADHLWDSFREKEPFSERGIFYQNFRLLIVSFLIFMIFLSLFTGIYFEFSFLLRNFPLTFSFVFFLILIVTYCSPIPKEILVSVFYTLGVIAPFTSITCLDPLVWIFLIHVFANVLLTYNTDREFDLVQNTFTLNQFGKPETVRKFVRFLLCLGSLLLLGMGIWGGLQLPFLLGMGLAYLWLGVCSFLRGGNFQFKSLCEFSYLPLFLPQIFFFFSLLP